MRIWPDLLLSGAKLSTLTQATAYRAIRELRDTVHRKSTDENIQVTQEAVKLLYKKKPTAAAVWKQRHLSTNKKLPVENNSQSSHKPNTIW
jgi:ribonuclease HI